MAENNFTISKFCKDSKKDISEIVEHFLEFFIDDDFINSIDGFRKSLPAFQKSVDSMNSNFSKVSSKYTSNEYRDKLSSHGLNGSELIRKLQLFYASRKIFYKTKQEFVDSFKEFIENTKGHTDEPIPFEETEVQISEFIKKKYEKLKKILSRFRKIIHRHLDIINILFKSIISVVDVGGLASEFKDSLEAVIKSPRIRILKKTIEIFTSAVLMKRINY